MRGLSDKVVIITGAAGGIGAALCRRFAAKGAALALFDLAGDEAAFITGQVLSVSGGLTMDG